MGMGYESFWIVRYNVLFREVKKQNKGKTKRQFKNGGLQRLKYGENPKYESTIAVTGR